MGRPATFASRRRSPGRCAGPVLCEPERAPEGGCRRPLALVARPPHDHERRDDPTVVERAGVEAWVAGYEAAWRTPGTEALAGLFTEDATYSKAPYEEPDRGLAAIAELWEDGREGPDEAFAMASEVVAVDGDTAVVRVHVAYAAPHPEYRDLWVLRFAADGRCASFEEWPFWPGKGYSAPG